MTEQTSYSEIKDPLLLHEDDVELRTLRQFATSCVEVWPGVTEVRVETKKGTFLVGIQGERSRTAIVTFHDLGMNYISSFETFFTFPDVRILLDSFCVYHINAPGQEDNAETLNADIEYPGLDEMAELISEVFAYLNVTHFVGFGAGLGGYILTTFALNHPMMVDGLCLINTGVRTSTWIEWGFQKLYARNLRSSHEMTGRVLDFLLYYHFGKDHDSRPSDLQKSLRYRFEHKVNCQNLSMLLGSYNSRPLLHMCRELDPEKKKSAQMLQMPVLLVVGAQRCASCCKACDVKSSSFSSPHLEAAEAFYEKLDPSSSSWLKVADCAMPIEENPAKVAEAFRSACFVQSAFLISFIFSYFLQGLGFIPYMQRRISRQHSLAEQGSLESHSPPKTHSPVLRISEEK